MKRDNNKSVTHGHLVTSNILSSGKSFGNDRKIVGPAFVFEANDPANDRWVIPEHFSNQLNIMFGVTSSPTQSRSSNRRNLMLQPTGSAIKVPMPFPGSSGPCRIACSKLG